MIEKRYLDTQSVKLTEQEAQSVTRTKFGGTDSRLSSRLDTWFKMQHFTGTLMTGNSDAADFQSYAYFQHLQSPYTLLTAYELWQKAYYLEAATLVRHLVEVFVQLRYFHNHSDLCMKHAMATTAKDRVRFDVMFNEIAPGSYDEVYRTLSTIAHGNINLVFRGDLSAATPVGSRYYVTPFVGATFHPVLAPLVHNFLVSVLLGFYEYFGTFFPQNEVKTDPLVSAETAESHRWLKQIFDQMKSTAPDPRMFVALENLVCV